MALNLRYVVITSVDRDDLRDGGAQHFVDVIRAVRLASPSTTIETWYPISGPDGHRLDVLGQAHYHVMLNHNLETVPRLYKQARPGADYARFAGILKRWGPLPGVSRKSVLMVGLGRRPTTKSSASCAYAHDDEVCTIGQYLAPGHHLPVGASQKSSGLRKRSEDHGFPEPACP